MPAWPKTASAAPPRGALLRGMGTNASMYRAIVARDPRYDGLFFFGVRTTGIYCRPVCSARTPKESSCELFASASSAEDAGYRACFVCRPELAPHARLDGAGRVVEEALEAIERGALDEGTVGALAARLDVSERTLRRAFLSELGASPHSVAASRRLATAKRLLHDTDLSIVEIALASGYRSLRRFNAAFVARFAKSPSAVRASLRSPRRRAPSGPSAEVEAKLFARPPYRGHDLFRYLAARAIPSVERGDEASYARAVRFGGAEGALRARLEGETRIVLSLDATLATALPAVVRVARRVFDTDARPDVIDEVLSTDRAFEGLVAARPGLRVPGIFDPFEAVVRAVVGQRISVTAARTCLTRFAEALGAPLEAPSHGVERHFPGAADVVRAGPEVVARAGLGPQKASAIVEVARLAAEGLFSSPRDRVTAALADVRGIGGFTVGYAAMRGLFDPDGFPSGDLVIARVLGVSPARAEARVEALRPYRAYAALHAYTASAGGRSLS